MRPFNPDPITDRSRELFGTYMRRYETPPSMSAFDAAISERSRELYGEYRQRWSALKEAKQLSGGYIDADGVDWVNIRTLAPTVHDMTLHQLIIYLAGGWAGQGLMRIMVNNIRGYPFKVYEVVTSGNIISLWSLRIVIRKGDEMFVQVRSNNAGDVGPAQSSMADLYYTILRDDV